MERTGTSKDSILAEDERELGHLRDVYRAAVEEWIRAIRAEETLAGPDFSNHAVEAWEHAHFAEEAARTKTKQARQDYQDVLRRIHYNF